MSAECSRDTLGTISEGERDRGRRGKAGQGARLHADNGGSLTRRCGTSGSGRGAAVRRKGPRGVLGRAGDAGEGRGQAWSKRCRRRRSPHAEREVGGDPDVRGLH